MPYIKLEDRTKFSTPIKEVIGILTDTTDTVYVKGEYLGYFVNRVVKRFLADPDYNHNTFNSAFFNESKKKSLSNMGDSIGAAISRGDPIAGAAELDYAISAVVQGFLGGAKGTSSAGYGLLAYVTGIVERVRSTVETVNVGNQRDMTMTFRRHLIIRGVLQNILGQLYYAGTKLPEEQWPIWKAGELVLPQTSTALVEAE